MNDTYSFIRYTKNNFTTSEEFISIAKTKIITFSKGFLFKNNFNQRENRFVIFFYDAKKVAIGMRFTKNKTNDSFTVVYDKRGGIRGASISCGTFLNAFNIDVNKYSGRYPYKIVEDNHEDKLYVIKLKKHDD